MNTPLHRQKADRAKAEHSPGSRPQEDAQSALTSVPEVELSGATSVPQRNLHVGTGASSEFKQCSSRASQHIFSHHVTSKAAQVGAGRPVYLGLGHGDGAQAGSPHQCRLRCLGALPASVALGPARGSREPVICQATFWTSGGKNFSFVSKYVLSFFPRQQGEESHGPQQPLGYCKRHLPGREGRK